MRTFFALMIVCATGCDQLPTAGASRDDDSAATTGSSTPEIQPPRVRWTTPHEGAVLSSAERVMLVPEHGSAIEVLHVRVGLSSQLGRLSGDASLASLEILGRPTAHPIAMNATTPTLPLALVDPESPQTLDLFFGLPTDWVGMWGVFAWSVSTVDGPIPLRALLQIDGASAGKPALAGRDWWFASSYPWPTYRHQDGIITVQPPTTATLLQPQPKLREDDDRIPNPCDQW